SALSACGRPLLWPVRIGPGALLRLGRRRTAALAATGEPDATGDCGGRRMAGPALGRGCLARLSGAERRAGRLWAYEAGMRRGRGLVRPRRLAAQADGAGAQHRAATNVRRPDEMRLRMRYQLFGRRTGQRVAELALGIANCGGHLPCRFPITVGTLRPHAQLM